MLIKRVSFFSGYSPDSFRDWIDQVWNVFCWYVLFPQKFNLWNSSFPGSCQICGSLALYIWPNILNHIQIRTLRWLIQSFNAVLCQKYLNHFTLVGKYTTVQSTDRQKKMRVYLKLSNISFASSNPRWATSVPSLYIYAIHDCATSLTNFFDNRCGFFSRFLVQSNRNSFFDKWYSKVLPSVHKMLQPEW